MGNSRIDWKAERADQGTKREQYSEDRIKPHGRGLSQVTRTRVLRVARVRRCESCEERGGAESSEEGASRSRVGVKSRGGDSYVVGCSRGWELVNAHLTSNLIFMIFLIFYAFSSLSFTLSQEDERCDDIWGQPERNLTTPHKEEQDLPLR